MTTDPDTILLEAEEHMKKALDYLTQELRGFRTGRATTGLIEFVKVDCYGSSTDLKSIAAISVPEPTQLLVKPFDPSTIASIKQGIEDADLGLNPQVEAKQIRINVPPLSKERRQQMASQIKKAGEEQKVVIRNARRDANKHADQLDGLPEDEVKTLKEEIQELLKSYEGQIDSRAKTKAEEIMEV